METIRKLFVSDSNTWYITVNKKFNRLYKEHKCTMYAIS